MYKELLLNFPFACPILKEAVIAAVGKYDTVKCDTAYYLSIREEYNRKITAHELDAEWR